MATLTIRNLPEKLHRRLKEQAARNRRSLNQEAIVALAEYQQARENGSGDGDSKTGSARTRIDEAEKKLDALRRQMPRFLGVRELDAAKRRGRR